MNLKEKPTTFVFLEHRFGLNKPELKASQKYQCFCADKIQKFAKRISQMRFSGILILLFAQFLFIFACGSSGEKTYSNSDGVKVSNDELYPMSWNKAEHIYGTENHILTISELLGPKGASIDNMIPGVYVARGTYDLTETSFKTGIISLGFIGVTIYKERQTPDAENSNECIPIEGQTREKKDFVITDGQLSGTYEVTEWFSELQGPGNPDVSFVVCDTVEDSITLY